MNAVVFDVDSALRITNCANPFPDPDARIVANGNIDTFEPVTVSTNDLLMQGQSPLTHNSNLLSQTSPKRLGRSAEHAMALVADGTVRLDVTPEYELANTEAAIANLNRPGFRPRLSAVDGTRGDSRSARPARGASEGAKPGSSDA